MTLLDTLWDDYIAYWRRTGSVQGRAETLGFATLPAPHKTRERLGALHRMAVWCVEHDADPRMWLYTLFASRRWTWAPSLDKLTPKAHLRRYRQEHKLTLYTARLARERRRGRAPATDPNLDILPSTEALKASLARSHRGAECMALTQTETFGYHPKSPICVACEVAAPCAQALLASVGFDLVALRRGDITVDQARAQQRAGRFEELA